MGDLKSGRKRLKRWQALATLLGGSLLMLSMLAACGPSASTKPGGNSSQPKAGGSVVDIFDEDVDSFLPWNTGETFGLMAQQEVWAGLWNTDQNVNITLDGGIAKELPSTTNGDVSSDLTTFTIKLKPNLKWSDGSAETAQDCVDTFTFLSDPAVGDLGAFPTTDPKDPFVFVSATKVDTTTFKLQFKNPMGPFLAYFANGGSTCMPSAFIKTVTPATFGKSAWNFQPQVTNGPFTVKERVGGSHITVVKNPNYFDAPKPYLNQITDQIITDSNTILQAFQANNADSGWFLDPTKLTDFKALPGYSTYIDNGAGFEWLIYNMHDPILKDKVVRQALQESIDPPNEIYNTVYHGTVKQTCDDHAGTFAHEPNLIPCYKFNQSDAGAILDADGWKMGSDGFRHNAAGQTLELEYATTAKQARENTQAIFIQDWKKIGIKVNQKNYSNTQDWFGTGALCQGKFQIGEFANSITDPDDHSIFESDQTCDKGGGNYNFYSNATVDQQEKVQIGTIDQTARKAAFHVIHQQILQDIPCTYLFAPANLSVHANRVQNYLPSPAGAAETQNVWDWWVTNA